MTYEELEKFLNALADKADAKHPGVRIDARNTITGHIAVVMSVNGETECYMINPVEKTWMKHYGPFQ